MTPNTIAGAITLLFSEDPSGTDADYQIATQTLKPLVAKVNNGVVKVPQDQRDLCQAKLAEAFDDFVSDHGETVEAYNDEDDPRTDSLKALAALLVKKEGTASAPSPPPLAMPHPTLAPPPSAPAPAASPVIPTVSADVPVAVAASAAPVQQRASSPSGSGGLRISNPSPESSRTSPAAASVGSASPASVPPVRPVRRPPSTALPQATQKLLKDRTYQIFAPLFMGDALATSGHLSDNFNGRLGSLRNQKPLVAAHITLMVAWIRQGKHETDLDPFELTFGVKLPTS